MTRRDPVHELHHPEPADAVDEVLRRLEAMRADLDKSVKLLHSTRIGVMDKRLSLLTKAARTLRKQTLAEQRLQHLRDIAERGNE